MLWLFKHCVLVGRIQACARRPQWICGASPLTLSHNKSYTLSCRTQYQPAGVNDVCHTATVWVGWIKGDWDVCFLPAGFASLTSQLEQEKNKQTARKKYKWSEDRMKGVREEYWEIAEAGYTPKLRVLARAWNVPKSAQQMWVKGVLKDYKHIAPKEDEAQLAELVEDLSKRGFSMRKPEIQVFGAQFAEARGIKGLVP